MDTTHTQFIASIILPLMLLICTAVYTVINYKMLKESKATRLQKITPNIVAYLSTTEIHGSGTLILYITNIGEGVARNVKCEIYKDFEWIKGDPLCNRGIFKSGINVVKDMMGTMSNTLILAFTGGAVNTMILIYAYIMPYMQVVNMYSIGIEVIKGISGTLGIVLTVPLVSLISAKVYGK